MTKKRLLQTAEKHGYFDDLVCPNCSAENEINWRKCKKNHSGVWYECKNCGWLDVIGWNIVKNMVEEVSQEEDKTQTMEDLMEILRNVDKTTFWTFVRNELSREFVEDVMRKHLEKLPTASLKSIYEAWQKFIG